MGAGPARLPPGTRLLIVNWRGLPTFESSRKALYGGSRGQPTTVGLIELLLAKHGAQHA